MQNRRFYLYSRENELAVSEAKLTAELQCANGFLEGKLCIGLHLSFP